jgi:hypothetical protein
MSSRRPRIRGFRGLRIFASPETDTAYAAETKHVEIATRDISGREWIKTRKPGLDSLKLCEPEGVSGFVVQFAPEAFRLRHEDGDDARIELFS